MPWSPLNTRLYVAGNVEKPSSVTPLLVKRAPLHPHTDNIVIVNTFHPERWTVQTWGKANEPTRYGRDESLRDPAAARGRHLRVGGARSTSRHGREGNCVS